MEHSLPWKMHTVSIFQLIKNSITTNDNEIMSRSINFKCNNVWVGNNNLWVSIKFWQFCFNISEGSANRKPTRENTMRSENNLTLKSSTRLLNVDYGRILVYAPIIPKNSFHFNIISRFVVI